MALAPRLWEHVRQADVVDVFIPTLGHSPVLLELVDLLDVDVAVSSLIVGDNGIDLDTWCDLDERHRHSRHKMLLAPMRGRGLYSMWNQAIKYAATRSGVCAILNDDIRLQIGDIRALYNALTLDDFDLVSVDYGEGAETRAFNVDIVNGTYRMGGIAGWCFMLKAVGAPQIDERFQVWYGDDDLVWKVNENGGRCGIVRGVTVEHLGSLSINQEAWVPQAAAEDRALWESLGRGSA